MMHGRWPLPLCIRSRQNIATGGERGGGEEGVGEATLQGNRATRRTTAHGHLQLTCSMSSFGTPPGLVRRRGPWGVESTHPAHPSWPPQPARSRSQETHTHLLFGTQAHNTRTCMHSCVHWVQARRRRRCTIATSRARGFPSRAAAAQRNQTQFELDTRRAQIHARPTPTTKQ